MTATDDLRALVADHEMELWKIAATRTRLARHMLDRIGDPIQGSALAEADEAYKWEKCSAWTRSYLRAAIENMLMWANTISPPSFAPGMEVQNSPRPYFTLARAGLEAGAQAVWVLKDGSNTERVHKHLRLAFHDLRQNALALEDADDKRAAIARERMAHLLARTAEAYDSDTIRKDEPRYSAMVKECAELAGFEAKDLIVLWRGASAAAHGKNWFHQVAYETTAGEEYEPGYFRTTMTPDPSQVTKMVEAASAMISAGVQRFAVLSGYDLAALLPEALTALRNEMREVLP